MEDNESPLGSNFIIGVLLIAVIVIFVGWNEPLRYRFMSRQQIEQELRQPTPRVRTKVVEVTPVPVAAVASPTPHWMWDPNRKTSLDREAYNRASAVGPNYYYNRYGYSTPYPYR